MEYQGNYTKSKLKEKFNSMETEKLTQHIVKVRKEFMIKKGTHVRDIRADANKKPFTKGNDYRTLKYELNLASNILNQRVNKLKV
jgi:hypothetical protein